MKKSLPALFFFFSLNCDAQYCAGGGPSSTADSNVQLVQINGESGTSINYTGCPGVTGVQNLTGYSVTLNAGSSYTLTVDFGTCQGNYYGVGEVFIDFNRNFIFESGESVGTWTGTPPVPASTFPFTVPSGAQTGNSRMRIIQWEGGSLPLNPCGSFTWGSVMDFGIQIGGGIDCSGYFGDNFLSPMQVPSLPYIDTNSTSVCYSSYSSVYSSPDVYYRFIAPASAANVTVSLCNSDFDTYLSLLDASGNLLIFNDDNSLCGTSSSITYGVSPGDTLYAVVEGWSNEAGQFIISIDAGFVSVEENENFSFLMSPNPAENFVRIENFKPGSEMIITTMSGQILHAGIYNTSHAEIDLSSFSAGIYFIKISCTEYSSVQKLIISKL